MRTKIFSLAFLGLWAIGSGAAWSLTRPASATGNCCAPGADCCNPPQACCPTGECCPDCCFPPSGCCVSQK